MYKGVIFDMDGVLVDSEYFYMESKREFFELEGMAVDDVQLRQLLGLHRTQLAEVFYPDDADKQQQLLDRYIAFREDHMPDYRKLIDPEAQGVLRELKKQGYKVGIASSSPTTAIEEVLRIGMFGNCVDSVVSGDSFAESKPHPAIYLHTIDTLQLPAEEIMVVEDSLHGIEAAKRAHLTVTARKDPRIPLDQSQAEYHIQQLSEVPALLAALNAP